MKFVTQVCDTSCNSSDCFNSIVPGVSVLLFPCGPNAIHNVVTEIIVDSFNRPSFFTRPHILKKIGKQEPPITNGDSSFSVIFERFKVWIGAALNHGVPNMIHIAGSRASAVTVLDAGTRLLISKAAARFCAVTGQTFQKAIDKIAAIAYSLECSAATSRWINLKIFA